MSGPPNELSREESLYLDGRLEPEAARRLEEACARDPDRARRIEAWRRNMDLWREDTRRQVAAADAGGLAARVARAVEHGPLPALRAQRAARRYAAAAIVLMTVGVVGTLAVGRLAPGPRSPGGPTDLREIEDERFDLHVSREFFALPARGER